MFLLGQGGVQKRRGVSLSVINVEVGGVGRATINFMDSLPLDLATLVCSLISFLFCLLTYFC